MLSAPIRLLFAAMASVESGNDPSAVGDDGQAIGIYQIHRAYWMCSGVAGRWEDCRNADYARHVIIAYWRKHCPKALAQGDLEVLARVHNGGPQGHKNIRTVPYWKKIKGWAARTTDGGLFATAGPGRRRAQTNGGTGIMASRISGSFK